MKLNNEISFYGDGLVPELAVQQAYISKDFFEQVMNIENVSPKIKLEVQRRLRSKFGE